MFQSAGMKQSLRYDQVSCRLQVEGLPDVSVGHAPDAVGILTGWNLQWVGRPELEGQRDHLVALMQVVLPYARHLISGVSRPFGEPDQPIEISPAEAGRHRLLLRSSQPDTEPLEVTLDDAELADLVRVLDALRLDPRLQLSLPVPEPEPLRARQLLERVPWQRRLAAPVGGVAVLALAAGLTSLLPVPRPGSLPRPTAETPAATAPLRPPGSPLPAGGAPPAR